MDTNSDYLFFDDEDSQDNQQVKQLQSPWKILIIDDDHEVHAVTKLVLSNFEWDNRKLHFFDAYSAKEALHILEIEDDIAVALVDVVMETDDAGLTLIDAIRNKLQNHSVRLVLRTGQPGQAPERHVIREYDVSDYKNKTELSDVKLDTLLCSSLRAYKDIITLECNQHGLEIVIKASSQIFSTQSREEFAITTLNQFITLLERTRNSSKAFHCSGVTIYQNESEFSVVTAVGELIKLQGISSEDELPSRFQDLLMTAKHEKRNQFREQDLLIYLENSGRSRMMFYIEGFNHFEQLNIDLLTLLSTNAAVCFENSELRQELEEGQRDVVYRLAEVMDKQQ